jgi:hypothetical protein
MMTSCLMFAHWYHLSSRQHQRLCVWLLLVPMTTGNTLEGFGIVTLASLLPVLAVELMAVIIGARWVARPCARRQQHAQATVIAKTAKIIPRGRCDNHHTGAAGLVSTTY